MDSFSKGKDERCCVPLRGKIIGKKHHECRRTQGRFKEAEKHRLNSGYGTQNYLHLNPPRYGFSIYLLLLVMRIGLGSLRKQEESQGVNKQLRNAWSSHIPMWLLVH